ncbi:AI-2E family transporter [Pelomonas sp. KK5]|uniref:AI-2E family transporter n=1 Tax=Pelomonas sp. KK5 TaxID=1855730 RepID=UPI00097C4794|nr:AI-2E family transporter [Pelomonas sp. KK5]
MNPIPGDVPLSPRRAEAIAIASMVLCLLLLAHVHALVALLAGLLAFALTHFVMRGLRRVLLRRRDKGHELTAGLVMALISLLVVGGIVEGARRLMGSESIAGLMDSLDLALKQLKLRLPDELADHLPDSVELLKATITGSLGKHAQMLAGAGTHALHLLLMTLVGWLVGVLAAMRVATEGEPREGLAGAWFGLWRRLGGAFERVAAAQAKIAAVNAALSAVFLLVIAPLAGWHIPYAKTLVLATFVCGLLPVIGNLVTNSMVTLLALSVSPTAAAAALAFLVIVHKLEYLLNARIQGQQIGAQAWELLIVLFAAEALFGVSGMVLSPVLYAFFKGELRRVGWLD